MSQLPSVSVIVPAFNEAAYLAGCLESLLAQDYPAHLVEIVVADNGSTDGTVDIARRMDVRTCVIPAVKVGAVRNHGVDQATGDIVAFIDADCLAPASWLRSGAQELAEDPKLGAVGGPYLADESANWMETAWAGNGPHTRNPVASLAGGSFFMRRSLFLEMGGFDGQLSAGEDDEFSHRIGARGLGLLQTPACAVIHLGWPKTVRQVFRRQFWQGSNQIEAAGSFFNPGLILVHLFTAATVALPILALARPDPLFLSLAALLLGLIPLVAALRRAGFAGTGPGRTGLLFRLWLIFLVYYQGRSVGLLVNHYSRISKHSFKTGK